MFYLRRLLDKSEPLFQFYLVKRFAEHNVKYRASCDLNAVRRCGSESFCNSCKTEPYHYKCFVKAVSADAHCERGDKRKEISFAEYRVFL